MPQTVYRGTRHLTTSKFYQFEMEPFNSEPGNGATPLHAAAEEGHSEVIQIMLDYGADVNSLAMGVAPIHLAAQYNRYNVTKGTHIITD
jgi:ankyrin repeat protein